MCELHHLYILAEMEKINSYTKVEFTINIYLRQNYSSKLQIFIAKMIKASKKDKKCLGSSFINAKIV